MFILVDASGKAHILELKVPIILDFIQGKRWVDLNLKLNNIAQIMY